MIGVIPSLQHGYSLGEFRVDSHKTQVWDHNTRVPAMFKGPGIAAGSVMPAIASMVDMGPTFIELATGAPPPEWMDGMSFASILTGKNPTAQGWKDAQLIEYQVSCQHPDVPTQCTRTLCGHYGDGGCGNCGRVGRFSTDAQLCSSHVI